MTLLARGIMVSLFVAAIHASTAPSIAFAQRPHSHGGGWGAPRSGAPRIPGGPPRNDSNVTVPRGDLRGAIIDNARQRSAPAARQEPPDRRRF
jgi:hypothetical protein